MAVKLFQNWFPLPLDGIWDYTAIYWLLNSRVYNTAVCGAVLCNAVSVIYHWCDSSKPKIWRDSKGQICRLPAPPGGDKFCTVVWLLVSVSKHLHTQHLHTPLHSFQVRAIISDFAVFITILTMVLVDYALGIPSPKLQVPNKFKVSVTEKLLSVTVLSILQ